MLTWAQAMKEYLPDDIRRIIAKFPPVNGLHFVLMNLVARCRGTEGQDYDPGRELLGSSAGLAVAVAYHWLFQGGRKARKDKWRIARRLLKMKRRQVAEYLHLEPRVLGVLAKLRPEAARPSRIFYINTAMADPSSSTCKALSHAPRPLGAGLCFLLTDPRLLAASTPSLISELAGVEKQVPHHPIVMRDALDLCEERGLRHRFKSIQDIHTVHRELTEDTIGRLKSSALINRSYLEPLAPGGEVVTEGGSVVVEPIVDRYGLHAEALLMKHCVASAEARIVAHESSIYSIVRRNADHEEVERATLEVRNGTDGPRLVQLKGKMNRAPTRALRIGINKWAAGVAHDRDWETLSEAQKVDRRGLLLDEDWDELGDNDVPY